MIHIGIDGNEANITKRVGSNLYAFELLKAIYQKKTYDKFTIYLKNDPLSDLPAETDTWRYRVLKPSRAWTQWRLPLSLYLNPDRPQVFFTPGHYAPRFSPIKTVITILDLAFLEYPNLFLSGERGYFQLKLWTDYSVRQASRIITISENTKRDIIKHYQFPADKITVAYPGVNLAQFTHGSDSVSNKVLAKYSLQSPYILYVGTIQPRKNLIRLIEAFEQLPYKYRHYCLVIAGSKGWLTEEFDAKINHSKVKDRIILTGYLDPQDLPSLYTRAACLVLIGLAEGFGIPPIEGLACGAIPVVSNTTSLPEVVGPGGILVDPFSLASIKHGIIKALELPAKDRQSLLDEGYRHLQQFSWDKAANTVLDVLYGLTL